MMSECDKMEPESHGAASSKSSPSLLEWANRILTTPDPHEKADLTYQAYEEWENGTLEAVPHCSREIDTDTVRKVFPAPEKPARPDYVEQVDPRKVKSGSKKALIHAVVRSPQPLHFMISLTMGSSSGNMQTHAESYAIDLSWDIILRFAFSAPRNDEPRDTVRYVDDITNTDVLPREFFDDWTKVAYEEAKHFKKWSKRLEELGSWYGELTAHSGLWDSAIDTADSLSARLSVVHMVHEARGLDVFPGMLQKLKKSEDTKSCEILEQNHKEEITHVAAGKKWFVWTSEKMDKDPISFFHETVRSKFRGALKPPFNEEKREAAGLTKEWYMPLASSS